MNNRLKQLRKHLGFNQTDFASKIGISQQAYARLESGKTKLTERQIKPICLAYNVSEIWLKTGTGKMFVELNNENCVLKEFRQLTKENQKFVLRLTQFLNEQ